MTHPLLRTARAVVKPRPPGHGPGKRLPSGAICTIVVPVPCRFALLLKLLIRMLPLIRDPVLRGTRAMPYGLTSPLAGTVEATTEMLLLCFPWAWAERPKLAISVTAQTEALR